MSVKGSKGSSKTKSQSQSTETHTLDPRLDAALFGNLQRAQQLADTPFSPYTGQRVAGFSPAGLAGQQALMNVASSNGGGALFDGARTAAMNASAYRPMTLGGQSYSPTSLQPTAINRGDIRDVSTGAIGAEQINAYYNPYQHDVIDTTMADLERQRQIQQRYNAANAAKAHAFGGTGAAVAAGLTDETFARQGAQTLSGLQSQGWTTALSAAQADEARRVQALSANQAADLSVANANAGFGQQAGLFNAGAYNDAARYTADQAYQASVANQQAGLSGAGINLQGGDLMARLAGLERSQAIENANLMNQVGEAQRGLTQAEYDAAYAEFLRAQQAPYQNQQMLNGAVSLIPNFGTTSSQSSGLQKTKKTEFGFEDLGGKADFLKFFTGG